MEWDCVEGGERVYREQSEAYRAYEFEDGDCAERHGGGMWRGVRERELYCGVELSSDCFMREGYGRADD